MAEVPVQSVKRALDALDLLAAEHTRSRIVTLRDVARHLGVQPSTARNILKTMEYCGYVSRGTDRSYRIGGKCRDLSRASLFSSRFVEAAERTCGALAERTGESVVLAALCGARRRVVLRVEGRAVVRASTSLEDDAAFFRMVTGRVLAAYASPDELESVVDLHGLPGKDWNGIDSRKKLNEALGSIRKAGCAENVSAGEQFAAFAVPVRGGDGQLLAALGLFLPAFRLTRRNRSFLLKELRAAARRIASSAG